MPACTSPCCATFTGCNNLRRTPPLARAHALVTTPSPPLLRDHGVYNVKRSHADEELHDGTDVARTTAGGHAAGTVCQAPEIRQQQRQHPVTRVDGHVVTCGVLSESVLVCPASSAATPGGWWGG